MVNVSSVMFQDQSTTAAAVMASCSCEGCHLRETGWSAVMETHVTAHCGSAPRSAKRTGDADLSQGDRHTQVAGRGYWPRCRLQAGPRSNRVHFPNSRVHFD